MDGFPEVALQVCGCVWRRNYFFFFLLGDKEKQRKEKTIMTNAGLKEPNREIKEEEEERRKKKKKKTKKIAVWRLLLWNPLQDLSGQPHWKADLHEVVSTELKQRLTIEPLLLEDGNILLLQLNTVSD